MKPLSTLLLSAGLWCATGAQAATQASDSYGNGALNKNGPGTLVLTGNNNFTGNITLTSGTLILTGNAITVGGVTTYAGSTVIIGGTRDSVQNVNGTFVLSGNTIINTGTLSLSYGSGRYPPLQNALLQLQLALQELRLARKAEQADYLYRAVIGVEMAMADVRLTVDLADGKFVSGSFTLPTLPGGVGNPKSNLIVPRLEHPKVVPPHVVGAIKALTNAMGGLQSAGTNYPVILPSENQQRALADITFALENSQAAINLANGMPAFRPKSASVVVASGDDTNFVLIELGVAGLVVAVFAVGVAVQRLRKHSGKPTPVLGV